MNIKDASTVQTTLALIMVENVSKSHANISENMTVNDSPLLIDLYSPPPTGQLQNLTPCSRVSFILVGGEVLT